MSTMSLHRAGKRRLGPRLGATAACVISSLLCAWALAEGSPPDAQTTYQKQVAACNSGQTNQDKATCLREAGAARDAAAKSQLNDPATAATYKENALQRCRNLPDADRKDCEARINGQGTKSGSVGEGGIIRELRTKQIGPGPAASQP